LHERGGRGGGRKSVTFGDQFKPPLSRLVKVKTVEGREERKKNEVESVKSVCPFLGAGFTSKRRVRSRLCPFGNINEIGGKEKKHGNNRKGPVCVSIEGKRCHDDGELILSKGYVTGKGKK